MLQIYLRFLMENVLKHRNLRVTPFRLGVLKVFNTHKNAISMSQIEEDLGKHDRITLYRTIKTFLENGIIHEIPIADGEKHLALCAEDCTPKGHTHQHEHIHFQCKKCNDIFCVDVDDFPEIKLKNFSVDSVEITAKGLCEQCA